MGKYVHAERKLQPEGHLGPYADFTFTFFKNKVKSKKSQKKITSFLPVSLHSSINWKRYSHIWRCSSEESGLFGLKRSLIAVASNLAALCTKRVSNSVGFFSLACRSLEVISQERNWSKNTFFWLST